MRYTEYDPEHWRDLQESFDNSFRKLSDSFFNGDIVQIISKSFDFARENPLCTALIAAVFVVIGFHIFALCVRSYRRG